MIWIGSEVLNLRGQIWWLWQFCQLYGLPLYWLITVPLPRWRQRCAWRLLHLPALSLSASKSSREWEAKQATLRSTASSRLEKYKDSVIGDLLQTVQSYPVVCGSSPSVFVLSNQITYMRPVNHQVQIQTDQCMNIAVHSLTTDQNAFLSRYTDHYKQFHSVYTDRNYFLSESYGSVWGFMVGLVECNLIKLSNLQLREVIIATLPRPQHCLYIVYTNIDM